MRVFHAIELSASGLQAERLRLDLVASNLANAEVTRTAEGGPFRRQLAVLSTRPDGGVQVVAVAQDPEPGPLRYAPGHPDADASGYVQMPNVDSVDEMVDMLAATRSYQANATAVEAGKELWRSALRISG